MTEFQRERYWNTAYRALGLAGVAGLAALSMWWLEIELAAFSVTRFWEFMTRFARPDWSVTELVLRSTFETLVMAFIGTSLAVVVSLPLSFLAASNVSPPWIAHPVKWFLGVIRSIPVVILAVLFLVSISIGPIAGIIAIAVHSIGMLSKFYAEEFETADEGILKAVEGTGATWLQTIRYGLIPQSIPQVISFTVYRLEMNFRDATVLGIVGAGGIGVYILLYVRSYQYDKVAVLLLVIIVTVTLLDQLTFWVRQRVR